MLKNPAKSQTFTLKSSLQFINCFYTVCTYALWYISCEELGRMENNFIKGHKVTLSAETAPKLTAVLVLLR